MTRRAKCTAGEHRRKRPAGRAWGWEWWGGQWQPQLGDNVCQVLALSGDTRGQGTGHLHRSSAPRLLPDFGSPLLAMTQSSGPCSHAA